MKLTLKADSKLNLNYVPVGIEFISSDDIPERLHLIVSANHSFKEPFYVESDGELFPVSLYTKDGYLDFFRDTEKMHKNFEYICKEQISEFIRKSEKAIVSLGPQNEDDWVKLWTNDEWSNTQGIIEYESKDGLLVKNFTFKAELAF